MKYRNLLFLMGVLCGGPSVLAAPSWWSSRGVIPPSSTTNDYAAVNLGQLKNMARRAFDELEENLPGGAGATVSNLVFGFANSNNYAAANIGQLKTVAKPFYDRLIAEWASSAYPWTTNTTADDADFRGVNIGQLKTVFGFDLLADTDSDGLPDWWEIRYFGATAVQNGSGDPDGDGFTNLQELAVWADPNSYNPPPVVVITHPSDGGTLP